MNRDRVLSILLLAGLWLAACDNRDGYNPGGVPVTFTSALEGAAKAKPSTRAADGSWAADDRLGIYMVTHNDTPGAPADIAGALAANVQYRTVTTGAATALQAVGAHISFPQHGSLVNFVAYYPYNSTLHTAHNHVYPVDVSTQEPLSAIDLLYHKGTTPYSRTSSAVPLDFNHSLSKLVITITPASGVTVDLSEATASLTRFPSQAGFNLADGSLNNIGATSNTLTPVKDTGISTDSKAVFTAILIPHTGADYAGRTLTLRIGGEDYDYILPDTHSFTQSTAYSYNFTLADTRIILEQNRIIDWEGGLTSWGNNLLTCGETEFSLPATASTGNTLTLSTTATDTPTFDTSIEEGRITETKPNWITGITLTKGTTTSGWTGYTMRLNLIKNIYNTPRTGYIHLEVSGLTIVIHITQAAGEGLYVNGPNPASFDFESGTQVSQSFTVTTNSLETTATLSYSTDGSAKVAQPDWLIISPPARSTDGTGVSTFTTTFSVMENTSTTTTRTCYIHILVEGIEKSVRIDQDKRIGGLVVGGATNCHMVAPGSQRILIPVIRAVSLGGMPSDASFTAVKLWDDNSVVTDVGTDGSGSSGYIMVTVNNSSRQGNALVALKSGNTIYWSWHIWVTTYNPDTAGSWTYNGYTFMDRNLGATDNTFSDASRGLFYQWGRKDPFPATDIAGFSKVQGPVNQQTAHRNPDKFYYNATSPYNWLSSQVDNLWGHNAGKSVYDPCPEGWCVPSYKNNVSPWNGLTTSNFTWQGFGTGRQYGSTTTSRHPAAGYRSYGNGSLSYVGSSGCCWSASPSSSNGYYLYFYSSTVYPGGNDTRAYGFSVRCSRE